MRGAENAARLVHPIAPVVGPDARVLILGSFPSVKSREVGFYYGHPQNRFWRVLAALWGEPCPGSTAEKLAFLHRRHIALWDVIESCEITGSSDASIKNARINDLAGLLTRAPIRAVFFNGRTAERLYLRHASDTIALPCRALPSTSPANAGWSEARLIAAWQPVRDLADGL